MFIGSLGALLMVGSAIVAIYYFKLRVPHSAFKKSWLWGIFALVVPGGEHIFVALTWPAAKREFLLAWAWLGCALAIYVLRSVLFVQTYAAGVPPCELGFQRSVLKPSEAQEIVQAHKDLFEAHARLLNSRVKSMWVWNQELPPRPSKVEIRLRSNGRVDCASLISSSGNQDFDDSVLRAIGAAAPFPAAPLEVAKLFETVRITFDGHPPNQ